MALINTAPLFRGVGNIVNSAASTVAPVTNVIEMLSNSSAAWALEHSSNLEAKATRQAAVREVNQQNELRIALDDAVEGTIQADLNQHRVESMLDEHAVIKRVHSYRRKVMASIPDSAIERLAEKNSLSSDDIHKAVKLGTVAKPETPTSTASTPNRGFMLASEYNVNAS